MWLRHKTSHNAIARIMLSCALLAVGALVLLRTPNGGAADYGDDSSADPLTVTMANTTEYLSNGGMEGDYYSRYPNHFVAPGWLRWWTEGPEGIVLPEYTYDEYYVVDGERSQRWHRLPQAYVAGLYQVTDVVPCTLYELSAWTRQNATAGAVAHSRLGFDPKGQQLTAELSGGTCDLIEFAPQTAWSSEQNVLETWERLAVVGEAASNKVTAILYSAPERGSTVGVPFYSTYWDAGSMVQVPFPDGKLPSPTSWAPSSFINVTSVTADLDAGTVSIDWTTAAPASTQVWYAFYPPATPVTPTTSLTHTVYFPLIAAFRPPSTYMTTLDTTPKTGHHADVSGVPAGHTVVFVALSRRPDGTACRTEPSALYQFTMNTGTLVALDSARVPVLLPEPIVGRGY